MRNFRFMTIVGVVLMLASLSACQTMTGRSAGRYIDDKTITGELKAKLTADRAVNLTRIGVKTVNGVVTLTGVADSPEEKIRAEEIAMKVGGVSQVRNEVQVRTPPSAAPR